MDITHPITARPTPCPSGATACRIDVQHCHDVSLEHADGSTECLLGPACTLGHALHDFHLPCSALDAPCPCVPEERPPAAALGQLADAA